MGGGGVNSLPLPRTFNLLISQLRPPLLSGFVPVSSRLYVAAAATHLMSAGLLKMARPRDVVCVEERRKRWYPIKRVARKNRERGWRGGAIMEAIVIKDEGESLIIFLLGRERIFQGSLELGTRTPYVGYRPLLLTNFGDNFSFSPLVFAIICPQCSI